MSHPKIRPLPTELRLKAEEELGESPERIDTDLQALKEWITQLDYMKIRTDDQFLIGFLRSSKYSIERCKDKLELYYRRKVIAPEIFPVGKATNPKILEILRLGVAIPFPLFEHPTAPKVVLIRAGMYDPSLVHISEVFQMAMMMNEMLLLEDDNYVVSGLLNIVDMRGIKAMHLAHFTPRMIEKILYVTQEALPIRQRGFHFLNLPLGFNAAFTLFKNLFNARNAARTKDSNFVVSWLNLFAFYKRLKFTSLQLEVHGNDVEKLFKFIPKSMFPTEYGGEAYSIADVISYWEKKFETYQDYFIDDEIYGIDESKADKTKVKSTPHHGAKGTFRSMSIDWDALDIKQLKKIFK